MRSRAAVVAAFGAGLLVGLVMAVGTASPAAADPLCQSASVSGTLTGPQTIGPFCIPYGLGTICNSGTEGLSPTLLVSQTVCIPKPN